MKYILLAKAVINKVLDKAVGPLEMAILGIVVISTLSYALAWQAPGGNPPVGNTDSPINVSSNAQVKGGNLVVNALGITASGNALLVSNGNVGIGTTNPTQKLDVAGGIKISDSGESCGAANAGLIKFTGTDFMGCVNGAWKSLAGAAPVATIKNLVYNQHTEDQCVGLAGSVVNDGGTNNFCKFTRSACPSGWTQFQNWSSTAPSSGSYQNEDCNSGACTTSTAETCSVGGHSSFDDRPRDSTTCNGYEAYYAMSPFGPVCSTGGYVPIDCAGATSITVYSSIINIGCY